MNSINRRHVSGRLRCGRSCWRHRHEACARRGTGDPPARLRRRGRRAGVAPDRQARARQEQRQDLQARRHALPRLRQARPGLRGRRNRPVAGSATGVVFAAAEGVSAKIIASLARESSRAFSTAFYVRESSPIKSVPDMKGKVVGINGFSTAGHLWLRSALEKHGLTDKDVTITPVPFPAMQEALRAGKVDVGEFPQPFAALLEKQAKVKQAVRRQIWRAVRRGTDRHRRQGRVPEEERGGGARFLVRRQRRRPNTISKSRKRRASS